MHMGQPSAMILTLFSHEAEWEDGKKVDDSPYHQRDPIGYQPSIEFRNVGWVERSETHAGR
jgi:hypothetical protein